MFKRTLLDEIRYYGFYIWWNWITNLKWKIPNIIQRAYRGWGYADTWQFSSYLSRVIYGGLVHLKKNSHCYLVSCEGCNDEQMEKKSNETWDKMIYAFKLAKEIGEGKREFYCPKMDDKFQKKYKCLTYEENEAMKEGMKLFTEYFFHLWD